MKLMGCISHYDDGLYGRILNDRVFGTLNPCFVVCVSVECFTYATLRYGIFCFRRVGIEARRFFGKKKENTRAVSYDP